MGGERRRPRGFVAGWGLAAVCLIAVAGALPLAAQVERTPEPEPNPSPPTAAPAIRQVLRLDCASSLGRRDVALFSDGVIRLREGPPGEERLTLYDLDPDRLQGFLARLAEETPPDTGDLSTRGPGGGWVESCRLMLDLAGRERVEFSFARYDALSLARARLVSIARELGRIAEEALDATALPPGYEPQPGDVLKRRDGVRFRVVRPTGDGSGVELQGIDQPLTVYIPVGAIRGEFVALVSREDR